MFKKMLDQCKDPMKRFSKDSYAREFDQFYTEFYAELEALEAKYQAAEQKQEWIEQTALELADAAGADMENCRDKRRRTQRKLDLNMFLCVYIVPAVLKYNGTFSEAFADSALKVWNQTFDTNVGKATYEEIISGFRSKLCYITTAVCESLQKGPDCYELTLLRQFRDQYLEPSEDGRALVEEYYNIAPTIVKRMEREPKSSLLYQELYQEYLAPCITMIEAKEYEACKEKYRDMVLSLKARYIS